MGLIATLRKQLETAYLDERGFGSGRKHAEQLVQAVGNHGMLIDIGCGRGELRRQISSTAHYVGLDRYQGLKSGEYTGWEMRPDVIGDGHKLPFHDACCDAVAMMQVLEHMHYPLDALREACRVVKPSGHVFVDVPFIHEIHHAPNDFFRYTPFALARLANEAGLEVVEIKPSGGYARTLWYVLDVAPDVLGGKSWHAKTVRYAIGYPLKAFGFVVRKLQYVLDLYDRTQSLTCGYHCIFRKHPHEKARADG